MEQKIVALSYSVLHSENIKCSIFYKIFLVIYSIILLLFALRSSPFWCLCADLLMRML